MAQKMIIELADDTDGSEAHQTVSFAIRGVDYEIDLSDANAAALDQALAHYVGHARRVGGRRTGAKPGSVDAKAVRAWATQQGVNLGLRGRIPHQVLERYRTEASK